MVHRASIALFLTLVSGCGPFHEAYFKPNAENGVMHRDTCKGRAGLSNAILFEENDINFILRASRRSQKLQFLIRLKDSVHLVLPRTTVTMTANGKSTIFHLEKIQMQENFQSIYGGKLRDTLLQDPLDLQNDSPTVYYLFYPLDLKNITEFSLSIPSFFVNEKEISLPPIHWTLVEESFFLERVFIWNC